MHCTLLEYGKLLRTGVPEPALQRLQRLDEAHAKRHGTPIFDWHHTRHVRASSYVGVVQVPGLTVEILPKVDDTEPNSALPDETLFRSARRNLLYMLAYAGLLPVQERALAHLELERAPLLEVVLLLAARALVHELRCGLPHDYRCPEDNLPYLKGRLLMPEHLRHNLVRPDRCYVAYDAFIPDTWLNWILKAGCRRMLELTDSLPVRQQIRLALAHLQPVEDREVEAHHFDLIHLTRATERFGPLLEFFRMLLKREAPSTGAGMERTFSLLFPMEKVFEGFIAGFVRRHALELGLASEQIRVQARRHRLHLLQDEKAQGRFRLIPDLIIERGVHQGLLILDTKWKRLDGGRTDRGVSQSDLYQVYAYLHRYQAKEAVLLYPRVPGVSSGWYQLEADHKKRRIRVELVDISGDLRGGRPALLKELRAIIHGGDAAQ